MRLRERRSPASGKTFARAVSLGALVCLLGPATPASAAEAPRIGWHGEAMPEHLQKSGKRGEYIWDKDGSIMVFIPPGSFPMGSADGAPNEAPVHEVFLDGYYIDKYEVSWGQWKLSGLPYAEQQFTRKPYPEGQDWGILDDHPVLAVSWKYAKKYVEWVGKRLPTEAEWEKAARGTDARTYPWGNEAPTFERALWREVPLAKEKAGAVTCCPEGVSPYGVFNMAGNAYEWCEDYYAADFYSRSPERNPLNSEPGKYRVLRGGAFVLDAEDLRSAYRYRLREIDRAPYIGFRTVVSATPEGGADGS